MRVKIRSTTPIRAARAGTKDPTWAISVPVMDESGVIEIHDGRHPVVERVLKDALFVPNDTYRM